MTCQRIAGSESSSQSITAVGAGMAATPAGGRPRPAAIQPAVAADVNARLTRLTDSRHSNIPTRDAVPGRAVPADVPAPLPGA